MPLASDDHKRHFFLAVFESIFTNFKLILSTIRDHIYTQEIKSVFF